MFISKKKKQVTKIPALPQNRQFLQNGLASRKGFLVTIYLSNNYRSRSMMTNRKGCTGPFTSLLTRLPSNPNQHSLAVTARHALFRYKKVHTHYCTRKGNSNLCTRDKHVLRPLHLLIVDTEPFDRRFPPLMYRQTCHCAVP